MRRHDLPTEDAAIAQRGALGQALLGERGEPGAFGLGDILFDLAPCMGRKGIRDKLGRHGLVGSPEPTLDTGRVAEHSLHHGIRQRTVGGLGRALMAEG